MDIVALITAIGAFLAGAGGIISAIMLNRKTTALLEYRMNQVEKKLDAHNGYAKMFSETSQQISEIKTDIAVIKNSLRYIEKEADDGK